MARTIGTPTPATQLPPKSTDTHMHVYDVTYPSQPGGPPLPADAPDVSDYRRVQRWLGLARAVLVQANAYQLDHSYFLKALASLGDQARGVASISPETTEAELSAFHEQGVRGSRIMELPGGAVGMKDALNVNARIAPLDWSMILQFDGSEMVERRSTLERLQGNYVIDHFGRFLKPVTVDDPSFQALLKLIDRGNCYVKLAGGYETSRQGPPAYGDVAELGRALIRHAPERVIWGSNWPHVSLAPDDTPNDAQLLDVVASWIPDGKTRQSIFVDNPARLYGFDTSA